MNIFSNKYRKIHKSKYIGAKDPRKKSIKMCKRRMSDDRSDTDNDNDNDYMTTNKDNDHNDYDIKY